jgi:hypothetical protein
MTIYEEYTFYRKYCVDEDKGEIPLNFNEWKKEGMTLSMKRPLLSPNILKEEKYYD